MVEGLSHLTFIVQDLDRMEEVLVNVLGAERVYDSGENMFSLSPERFFIVAGLWIATMEGELSEHMLAKAAVERQAEECQEKVDAVIEIRSNEDRYSKTGGGVALNSGEGSGGHSRRAQRGRRQARCGDARHV